jgi:hypothetical protein
MFKQIAANRRAGKRQAAGRHGLSVQFSRTDHRKYSFALRTVEKWKNLPDDIKSAPNGEVFKSRIVQQVQLNPVTDKVAKANQ